MRQILDLHIHSKYSRACSDKLTLVNIASACQVKGINIIATGDFTYPLWLKSIKEDLEEIGTSGLYRLKKTLPLYKGELEGVELATSKQDPSYPPLAKGRENQVKFILSTEVALIYKDNDKCRRIHLVIHAPNIEAAEKLFNFLDKKFNVRSDGRPILGMSAPDLIKICLSIHPQFLIYPAHIWTPWFSVFGSKSGFNTLEECFHEQTENIYAYETGLSSDPEMNWRVSALDNLTLLSNSDAHSLANLGRECNIFDLLEITYNEIYEAIKKKDLNKIKSTIEFYPEEGMYHFDGHRDCNVCLEPEKTIKLKNICPKCKKPLVVGVLNRVEELSDRKFGFRPEKSYPFIKLVELDKIIAESLDIKSRSAAKAQRIYGELIRKIGPELYILIEASLEEIKKIASPIVASGIERVRAGKLIINPGFDGQYGIVKIFSEQEKKEGRMQNKLF